MKGQNKLNGLFYLKQVMALGESDINILIARIHPRSSIGVFMSLFPINTHASK